MQVTRETQFLLLVAVNVCLVHCLETFCLQNITQGDGGLIRQGLDDRDLQLRIHIVRVAASEEPEADDLLAKFEGKNEANP